MSHVAGNTGFLRRFGLASRIASLRGQIVSPSDPSSAKAAESLLRLVRRRGVSSRDEGRTGPLVALLARWQRLAPEFQERVLSTVRGGAALVGALDALTNEADPEARAAVVHIARADSTPEQIARLPALLTDPDTSVADSACALLAELVAGVQSLPTSTRNATLEAVAAAARDFERNRRSAVPAWLADLGAVAESGCQDSVIEQVLRDDTLPVVGELRTLIRRGTDAGSRERAWLLARHESLGRACQARLSERDEPTEHAAVLMRSSLAVNPVRAEALARPSPRSGNAGGTPRFMGLSAEEVAKLDEASRCGLVRLLELAPGVGGAAEAMVARLAGDPSPTVRHRLARLEIEGSECSAAARLDLCFDPDARVARTAVIASLDDLRPGGAGWGLDRAWARRAVESLARSPHAAVRAIGTASLARLDPRRADDPRSRLAARRRLRVDRPSVVAELVAELADLHAARVLRAMEMVRALELEPDVESEIVGLASGADERRCRDARVIATAAAMLGRCGGEEAGDVLRSCLVSEDQRVRANAVEALARRSRAAAELPGALVELKDDPHHRVRAGAIRGLMKSVVAAAEPICAPALGAMLGDARPMHRVAGLWLVERVGSPGFWKRWGELAGRVASLAVNDPEPAVRDRAARCAGAVAARIRVGWGG